MKYFTTSDHRPWKKSIIAIAMGMIFFMVVSAEASTPSLSLSQDVTSTLRYLLGNLKAADATPFDPKRLTPYLTFLASPESANAIYTTGNSFKAPSAFNKFTVYADIQRIIEYTMDPNIPSFFFWPSSLRLSVWTSIDGGHGQLDRLKAASNDLDMPFILKGTEHITITPDQHTGAYFSYDVDKMIILSAFGEGRLLISIQSQQAPSAVGRKGWVLGEDEEWSYLYTREKGLDVKGLGWADTYMYESSNVTVYYQPDISVPKVTCGSISWLKAGWAGINMVKSKHIHRGLTRVADAFTAVMENPRLPEAATLAETFSKKEDLPTPTLKKYTSTYFAKLERRLSASKALWKKVKPSFESNSLLDQMTRDEMYATLALDYFKKMLGHNPVMDTHPF